MSPECTPTEDLWTNPLFPPLTLIGLLPQPTHTPRYHRLSRQRLSHVVIKIGDRVWDQPINAEGACYDVGDWLTASNAVDRIALVMHIGSDGVKKDQALAAFAQISGRRGQPIRTVLRYFKLWPVQPWNCTSPVRLVLSAYGVDITAETPDAIFEEIIRDADPV